MPELVDREHLAPRAKLTDAFARIRRRRPEDDDRVIDDREREAVRDVERIVDDDFNAARRRVPDEPSDRGIDGGKTLGDESRPLCQLVGIVNVEAADLERVPREPGAGEELAVRRVGIERRERENDDQRARELAKTKKGRANPPVPSKTASALHRAQTRGTSRSACTSLRLARRRAMASISQVWGMRKSGVRKKPRSVFSQMSAM